MLKHSICLFCVVLLFFVENNTFSRSYNDKSLTDEMYDFFIKTVCDNYYKSDTIASLIAFVEGYKNSIMSSDYPEPLPFTIKVNKETVQNINRKLFIRDTYHYYYYYSDYIGLFPKQYDENLSALCSKYSYLVGAVSSADSTDTINYSFVTSPNITVNVKEGSFLSNERSVYNNIFKLAEAQGGYYSLFQFSCALLSGSPDMDLRNKDVQKIATVFYWKVLCQNAGIDFHKPLTTQPWEEELNAIVGE